MNLVEPDAAATSSSHDDDDAYSFSYLYNCSDGEPAVPTAYANGSWGSIAGDWYVIAGTQSRDSGLAGDCCRMKFAEPSDDEMNQWMMCVAPRAPPSPLPHSTCLCRCDANH
jgi:hypothetical protein